ncbi:hypothetical protein CFN78_20120 [Amycolatopsis antarctica]|uniref:VOC domain-containing protein n=1 Tax=Amycolatopsis antarctica TaxID=1854586 RepID=A0A263D1R0_9PSEU|nr:VOC family protein [Amycolatopsis antarctica]OZM71456.1 hypothetical protein CFN78_20120 [Amycolatopsis antarctica]
MAEEKAEFDHLLHWVPDVPAAVDRYRAAGLLAHVNEPRWGFQNGGWRLDERYVEILTVVDAEEFAVSPYAPAWAELRPAVAETSGRGGGAMTFAVNVPDATATAARLRENGHRAIEVPVAFDDSVGFVEVFLPDTPAWAPFFITYSPPREELLAGVELTGEYDPGPSDLKALVVETPEPERSARWLGELIGVPANGRSIPLPGAEVIFEQGPADRITGVIVTALRTAVEIHGLRYIPESGERAAG